MIGETRWEDRGGFSKGGKTNVQEFRQPFLSSCAACMVGSSGEKKL